jgi:ferric-dicitrate binding protein FerR (iron transport regulator)
VQAAAWQIQLAEADAEGSLDFESWRAADAQNAAAWNQLRGPWELLGEQATAPELIEMRRAALAQTRHAGRYRWIRLMRRVLTARIAIAAGLLAIAIGGLFYWAG